MSFLDEYGIEVKNVEYEEVVEKKKNIFEIMSASFTKKFKPTIEEMKTISPWLFHTLLSGDVRTLQIALFLNSYEDIPTENRWKFVNDIVPKTWITYPKKLKEDTEILGILQDEFCINKNTAREYLKMLDKKELKRIKNKHTITEGRV